MPPRPQSRLNRALRTCRAPLVAAALICAAAALQGCDDEGPALRSKAEPVIDNATWEAIPRDSDPFVTLMPEAVTSCLSPGVTAEADGVEFDTGTCGFISAQAPLTSAIARGERVRMVLWHLALYADPPAKGVMVVRIGDDEVWRLEVDIPHLEQVYQPEFTASKSWPKGTPVRVHVHNHGANTWKLYRITAGG